MYHTHRSDVVETDDILCSHEHHLERRDGRVFLHALYELRPDKTYDDAVALHVTNGASHRYLLPEHAYPVLEGIGDAFGEDATVEEEAKVAEDKKMRKGGKNVSSAAS